MKDKKAGADMVQLWIGTASYHIATLEGGNVALSGQESILGQRGINGREVHSKFEKLAEMYDGKCSRGKLRRLADARVRYREFGLSIGQPDRPTRSANSTRRSTPQRYRRGPFSPSHMPPRYGTQYGTQAQLVDQSL